MGFYADRFLIAGGQQIKIHSFSKNKETSQIHNDKGIASKSFREVFHSTVDAIQYTAREVIKIKLALFKVSQFQACPSPRHLSGICHFVSEKLQMPHGGALE